MFIRDQLNIPEPFLWSITICIERTSFGASDIVFVHFSTLLHYVHSMVIFVCIFLLIDVALFYDAITTEVQTAEALTYQTNGFMIDL